MMWPNRSRAQRPTKLYIAGPMANVPEFNAPAFDFAEAVLRERNYSVVNPSKLDLDDYIEHSGDRSTGKGVKPIQRARFLKRDFYHLAQCDGIIMLEGWRASVGANAELAAAIIMGMDVYAFSVSGVEIHTPWLLPSMGVVTEHMSEVLTSKRDFWEEADRDQEGIANIKEGQ